MSVSFSKCVNVDACICYVQATTDSATQSASFSIYATDNVIINIGTTTNYPIRSQLMLLLLMLYSSAHVAIHLSLFIQ